MSYRTNRSYLAARSGLYLLKRQLLPPLLALASPAKDQGVLPDFLIAGAMKSGTTSLYSYLCQHPGIVTATMKEIRYFSKIKNYAKGERWYRAQFPSQAVLERITANIGYPAITGEATPTMQLYRYPAYASELIPDAKIIMILRNPVDRAYSHFQDNLRNGRIPAMTFRAALQFEQDNLATDIALNNKNSSAISYLLWSYSFMFRGQYLEHIKRWLQYYKKEQMLFIDFNSLVKNPTQTCNKISSFLGLPEHEFNIDRILNTGNYTEVIDDASMTLLTNHFQPHNKRLFEFLGEDWGW